jgi:uncharacterized protein YndB with AHSA1/START domain
MRLEIEHVVAAPVERVFAVVSDISRRPNWVGIAQQRSQIGDGPIGEGTQYRAVDKVPGRTLEYTQTIERLEQNQLLEESWGGPMGGHSLIRFHGDDTSTNLTIEAEVASPLPGALSFLEPLARTWAKRMFKQDLDHLNELVAKRRS